MIDLAAFWFLPVQYRNRRSRYVNRYLHLQESVRRLGVTKLHSPWSEDSPVHIGKRCYCSTWSYVIQGEQERIDLALIIPIS